MDGPHASAYQLLDYEASLATEASNSFLSEQTNHQQPANSPFLSKQINISHQPPAKRTGCLLAFPLFFKFPTTLF
jgi:hypothetical protein